MALHPFFLLRCVLVLACLRCFGRLLQNTTNEYRMPASSFTLILLSLFQLVHDVGAHWVLDALDNIVT